MDGWERIKKWIFYLYWGRPYYRHTTPSLNVSRPENVSVRKTQFSIDKYLGTEGVSFCALRLPTLMNLYIHPLYVLVSKILSSILNSPSPIHPLYHIYPLYPLWDPLVALSKYIHVWSSFQGFIETNLMVKSKFNLNFCFVSYIIFFLCLASGACQKSKLNFDCTIKFVSINHSKLDHIWIYLDKVTNGSHSG
jgi:hypothetical protein